MTYRAWELKNLDRAALLRFTGFCHKNAPIIKRKRTFDSPLSIKSSSNNKNIAYRGKKCKGFGSFCAKL